MGVFEKKSFEENRRRRKAVSSEKSLKLYEDVARILDNMKEGEISFKEAFANTDLPSSSMHKAYAIAAKVVTNWKLCNEIIEESGIVAENPGENINTIKSIVADLLWGSKNVVGRERIFDIVRGKKDVLFELGQKFGEFKDKSPEVVFVRVNTIKYKVHHFVTLLKGLGYHQMPTPTTYSQYLAAMSKLKFNSYMKDYHFDDLFVFSSKVKSQICQSQSYQKKRIAIQDKASLIPVNLLKVEPGTTVLDMCAAPGMKTAYLAAQLQKKGKIIAVDRDKKRFQTMVSLVDSFGASDLIEAVNNDIMRFECDNEDIDFILLDAPCSGSGIRGRLGETTLTDARLKSLQWIQIKMLTQALTQYPNAMRIVYSTCSVRSEENESVVDEAIEKAGENSNFKLIDCHQILDGFSKGSSDFKCGSYCIKLDPKRDHSNGFFTAIFENKNVGKSPAAVKEESERGVKRELDESDDECSSNNNDNQNKPDIKRVRVQKNNKKRNKNLKNDINNKTRKNLSQKKRINPKSRVKPPQQIPSKVKLPQQIPSKVKPPQQIPSKVKPPQQIPLKAKQLQKVKRRKIQEKEKVQ